MFSLPGLHDKITLYACSFDSIQRSNYFGGEPIGRAEVKVRVGKHKNGKAAGEMTKGGGDRVVNQI